jgi:hypothetical protein
MMIVQLSQFGIGYMSLIPADTCFTWPHTPHLNSYIATICSLLIEYGHAHYAAAIALDYFDIGWECVCYLANGLCSQLLFDPALIFDLHRYSLRSYP